MRMKRWDSRRYAGDRKTVQIRDRVCIVPTTLDERFKAKIAVRENGCWEWTASLGEKGYGRIRFDGVEFKAFAFVYAVMVGDIPEDRVLGHRCHDEAKARGECIGGMACLHRRCVNPKHLVVMTQKENLSLLKRERCSTCGEKKTAHPGGKVRCMKCHREYGTELVRCECGKDVQRRGLLRHRQSAKHLTSITNMP